MSILLRLSISDEDIQKYKLEILDLLVTRTGSIGRCAIFPGANEPCIPGAYLIQFRLCNDNIEPYYVLYFLLSAFGQKQLLAGATSVTQANVNAPTIRKILFPLPPLNEQKKIVNAIEEMLSQAEEMEELILKNIRRAERLRQAILREAFAGRLVAQDAADEPARVLLERIRADSSANLGPHK